MATGGTKDVETIVNNVIREEYGQLTLKSPNWMIDAGAYIGDTSVYFLSKYPGLKVLALEPNPDSIPCAKENLLPYGERAQLLEKGLYGEECLLHLSGLETGATISSSGTPMECTTVDVVMKQYGIEEIDILKMDIEGAEVSVFESDTSGWLCKVKLILIETHGPRAHEIATKYLPENNFRVKLFRNLWYCENMKYG